MKIKNKILPTLLAITMSCCLCATLISACTSAEHECEHVCPQCGKCTSDCTDPVCQDKCLGHETPTPTPGGDDRDIPEGATLGACICEDETVWLPGPVEVKIRPTKTTEGVVASMCQTCGYSAYYWELPALESGEYAEKVITAAGEKTFGSAEYSIVIGEETYTFSSAINPTGEIYKHREECENMDMTGCTIKSEAGANNPSNGAYAGGMSVRAGSSVSYTFVAKEAGQALLYIFWGNNYTSTIGEGDKDLRLTINGKEVGQGTQFLPVYDKDLRYFEWTLYEVCIIDIQEDINVLTISNPGGGAASNLDYFDLVSTVEILPKSEAHACSNQCPLCGLCLDETCTKAVCAEKCQGHNNDKYEGLWAEVAHGAYTDKELRLQPNLLNNVDPEALVTDDLEKGLDLSKVSVGTKISYYLSTEEKSINSLQFYFTLHSALEEGKSYDLSQYVKITINGEEFTGYTHSANWTDIGYLTVETPKQYTLAAGEKITVEIEVLKNDANAPVFNELRYIKDYYGYFEGDAEHNFLWSDKQIILSGRANVNTKESCIGVTFGYRNAMTIKFYSEEAAKGVKLYFTTSSNTEKRLVTDVYDITLNGQRVESQSYMPIGTRYQDYTETFIANVDLVEGLNTLEFVANLTGTKNNNTFVYNFRQATIRVLPEGADIAYNELNHTCESVCPIDGCGKCTDFYCTDTACAEKCSVHGNTHNFLWSDEEIVLTGTSVNVEESSISIGYNKKNTITIQFYSSQAVSNAKLFFVTSSNSETRLLTDVFTFTLNGQQIDSQSYMPIGTRYSDYTETFIAGVDLVEGLNTLVIEADLTAAASKNVNTYVYNLRQVSLRGLAEDVTISYEAPLTENED